MKCWLPKKMKKVATKKLVIDYKLQKKYNFVFKYLYVLYLLFLG